MKRMKGKKKKRKKIMVGLLELLEFNICFTLDEIKCILYLYGSGIRVYTTLDCMIRCDEERRIEYC
jgi:hypothetical protein